MSADVDTWVTVHATLRWKSGHPRFKTWFGAKREAEWYILIAEARVPIVADDIRVSGRGNYVKSNGEIGQQTADLRFGRLAEMPDDVQTTIHDALRTAAEATS